MPPTTSIPSTLSSFDELWEPRLVAAVNDQHVKIAKIDGGFLWHSHPDSDELFYLMAGDLILEVEAGKDKSLEGLSVHETTEDGQTLKFVNVQLVVGDTYVVPRGVRHRPVAKNAHIMMIEKAGTINTGDVQSERTVIPKDVRGSA